MKAKLVIVAGFMACALGTTTSAAQVFVGDSVRVRDDRQLTWHYGQLIAQEPGRLLLLRGHDSVYVALARLQRLERWQRYDKLKVLGAGVALGVLTATAAYFLMPEESQTTDGGCVITGTSSVCTTRTTYSRPMSLTTMQLWGGLGGAVGGFIGLSITPGRWRVIVNR